MTVKDYKCADCGETFNGRSMFIWEGKPMHPNKLRCSACSNIRIDMAEGEELFAELASEIHDRVAGRQGEGR